MGPPVGADGLAHRGEQGEVFVRRLALAASQGQVFLYYQDEESGQFAGPVDVISVSRLESAVSGLSGQRRLFCL